MIDYSLYLCTNGEMNSEYSLSECVKQAIDGGVTFVQFREKIKYGIEFIELAKSIKKITDKYNIPFVINDNVKVAIDLNSDGVHIGQNDISCLEARKILGPNKIIGVSVRTFEEAKKAIIDGATYLGVGAIYKSRTKPDAKIVEKCELKKILRYSTIPVVVIGGINKNTINSFKELKPDGYAMIRPILGQKNIKTSTQTLKKIINGNITNRNSNFIYKA